MHSHFMQIAHGISNVVNLRDGSNAPNTDKPHPIEHSWLTVDSVACILHSLMSRWQCSREHWGFNESLRSIQNGFLLRGRSVIPVMSNSVTAPIQTIEHLWSGEAAVWLVDSESPYASCIDGKKSEYLWHDKCDWIWIWCECRDWVDGNYCCCSYDDLWAMSAVPWCRCWIWPDWWSMSIEC